jgi:hypothetical protein
MPEKSIKTTQPKRTRAEINRENAKKSTGPKTAEGKAASSKNAIKHGIYSKFACIPGEDPEKLDALRADLRAEHQPASLTEEILVDELAHHYWRIKRYRYLESHMWTTPGRDAQGDLCADTQRVVWMIDHGLAALYHRALNSADRSFYRTLKTLQETKKATRTLVSAAPAILPTARKAASGFVPQNSTTSQPSMAEMFATIQSHFGLSRSEVLKLLPTAA